MAIKRYVISAVEPGMKLARPIFRDNGQVILYDGTVLTNFHIEKLRYFDVSYIDIIEHPDEYHPAQDVSAPPSDLSTIQGFQTLYDSTVNTLNQAFNSIRFLQEIPLAELRSMVGQAIMPMIDAVGVISHLQNVQHQDEYTFHHSLDVAVISGVLARWMGYTGQELEEIILSGLLHDVGKARIPLAILNKPEKLTTEEMDIMKLHTSKGYQMLNETKTLSPAVLCGVLQHHEKLDGSGYPLGVNEEKIHPYAKIIAVADIYCAMTSDRVYHKRRTPFKVVEHISQEMFNKLDPAVCTAFMNNVKDYFLGSVVKLSDGREAEVVYLGIYSSSRPVVRTKEGEFIDLERNKKIVIEG
ncbi:MAG TPA: HD-GYP domain-containing protein [Methylomusa anaerophila]|uniref:Cyclic di-GMP phosphodiesterase response regulator RpfG n=2 Tax=Methylomusa anaerophila TaxID=1930071 RepID=A0A348AQX4_9FIRM|nr:HD-GYP domain-containing protein [Methylomusa anaerophila]BBB93472.1 cyclic di-GMP phosphodiesterase response regulator RpfG [Methylomusa anaerophila]HML90590.1 HD-GYP domain-containing protein [Methylomusa anaerophila]